VRGFPQSAALGKPEQIPALRIVVPDEDLDVDGAAYVLEHVERRVELLRRIVESSSPQRVLFRVPVLARDWTIPLRQEVGVSYFSDPGHFVEYDPESFRRELAEAGLRVSELILIWGEIWAAAEPAGE
jgi:hypothetical protein